MRIHFVLGTLLLGAAAGGDGFSAEPAGKVSAVYVVYDDETDAPPPVPLGEPVPSASDAAPVAPVEDAPAPITANAPMVAVGVYRRREVLHDRAHPTISCTASNVCR